MTVEEALADGRAVHALVLPEYWPMLLAAEEAATRDHTDLAVEVPIRRKGGEVRWARLRSREETQPDGAIVRNGVAMDITAEKQLEARLLEAAERDSFRLELADAIKPLTDPFEIVAVASERLGKKLGCHQVVYSEIDAKQEYATIKREWTTDRCRRASACTGPRITAAPCLTSSAPARSPPSTTSPLIPASLRRG